MHGLRHDPAAGRHDDAGGRRQARAYRGSKRHQREYPGVEKQETLNAGGDNGGLADGVRRRGDDGERGDKQAQRAVPGRLSQEWPETIHRRAYEHVKAGPLGGAQSARAPPPDGWLR